MDNIIIEKMASKGAVLVESSDTIVFRDVRVTGLAAQYATLYIYTENRVLEIECIDGSTIRYPIILPSDISDYAFDGATLSVEIRGGDGRRFRAFDSEWWPLTFASRYEYERMVALICYFLAHKKEDKDALFTTDFIYTTDVDIAVLDDAPLLFDVSVEEFEYGRRISEGKIYDIQFTNNPIKHQKIGGYRGLQDNKVIRERCFPKTYNTTFSVSKNKGEYKIRVDEELLGHSEILEFSSLRDRDVALQCFDLMFGFSRSTEEVQGDIICPVCKKGSAQADRCLNCGFTNLAPTFICERDAEDWMMNTVTPYREAWMKQ